MSKNILYVTPYVTYGVNYNNSLTYRVLLLAELYLIKQTVQRLINKWYYLRNIMVQYCKSFKHSYNTTKIKLYVVYQKAPFLMTLKSFPLEETFVNLLHQKRSTQAMTCLTMTENHNGIACY